MRGAWSTLARCRTTLLLVFLSAPLGWGAPAPRGDWRPVAEAADRMVPRLLEVAEWCGERRMYRERAEVYEAVLVFDPDHALARRRLGYRRRRDGEWTRRDGWRPPRLHDEEGREEFERRLAAVIEPFVAEVLAGLRERRARTTSPERERIHAALLRLAPDFGPLRAARGEVRHEGEWLLAESVRGIERRPRLVELARAARKGVAEPVEGSPTPEERATGLPFTWVREGDGVRVVATVDAWEAKKAAELSDAAATLFREALDTDTCRQDDFVAYLLEGAAERDVLFRRLPGVDKTRLPFLAGLQCGWLGKGAAMAAWTPDPAQRLEWVVRQTIYLLLSTRYGITTRQGALCEGLGIYLTHLLVGRRNTWYVAPSDYGEARAGLDEKLRDEAADWFALARERVAAGEGPDYRVLLGADVSAMGSLDVLHAYVLGAYLLEGDPPGRDELLTALGEGASPAESVPATTGRTVPELERRVIRWLRERP